MDNEQTMVNLRVENVHSICTQESATVPNFDSKNVLPRIATTKETVSDAANRHTKDIFTKQNQSPTKIHDTSPTNINDDDIQLITDSDDVTDSDVSPVKLNGSAAKQLNDKNLLNTPESISVESLPVATIKIQQAPAPIQQPSPPAQQVQEYTGTNNKQQERMNISDDNVNAMNKTSEPTVTATITAEAHCVEDINDISLIKNEMKKLLPEEEATKEDDEIVPNNINKESIVQPIVPKDNDHSSIRVDSINKETDKEEGNAKKASEIGAHVTQQLASERRGRKRSCSSTTDDSNIPATKKLCLELEKSFGKHDKVLQDYIESTSTNDIDEIQRNVAELNVEILQLNELSRAKELEWNNILHLKKVKEEILLRLLRKKSIMEIMSTKVGEVAGDYSITLDQQPPLSKKITTKEMGNTALHVIGSNMVPLVSSTPAQSILQSRANMKPADLAKEKVNTARLQR